ncbi:MAG: YccF domain-containing protein [Acidimicrobiia bacterium]
MRTIGNSIWLLLAGIWLAFAYVFAGLLNMITIIGIPFGIQAFKLAGYALWPFGRVVVNQPGGDVSLSTLGNVVWFIFGGWFLVMTHLITGVFMMFTIIGIPLGLANIKMAGLALAPFGKQIVPLASLELAVASGQIAAARIVSNVTMLEDKPRPQLVAGEAKATGSASETPKD